MTLWIDIETRSRTDLKKLGVYKYVEDPDFSILMAGWTDGTHRARVAVGHEAILDIPGLLDPTVRKVAHNAPFERLCLGQIASSLQDPEQWDDTMAIAAEWGHPWSLEDVAKAVGAEAKDQAGKALVKLFTVPNRDGSWNTAETHPDEWMDFIAYCAQDVDTLVDVHARLGDWPTPMERRVWVVDQLINDRGMGIDLELCKFAAEAVDANKVTNKAEFTSLTGVDNPGSVQQVKAWADLVGLDLPDCRAETVEALIADPDTHPDHVKVLELRQDLALAAGGKFTAALAVASPDSRIRGGFQFFGAHTGRWTGRRVQPQNLPRATVDDPEAAILDLKMGLGADPHTLKALVRSMFVGPFTVVDYAAIEARVLAWIAGEEWAIQAFKDGRDIYVETAERMSTPGNTLTRSQGKVAVLALGYNGAVGSLRAMGAEGEDEDLLKLVTFWRKANSKIVRMWDRLGDAVDTGGPVGAGLVHVTRDGTDMQIHLPSGRAISYHGVQWKRYSVVDPATKKRIAKQGWVYSDPKKGGHQIGTYGGRLVENVTQAIARDLLAEALVRLEDAGYRTVGHVHDEVIVESDQLEDITRIVTENPPWATGLPLSGEGFVTERYRKG